ncbi:hypothetical protein [Streptomyces sp. NPDC013181]|uniref:hypothetical protein n=1 Tax=Streptomyces sp. NPDC013181 TaxID=3364864 RepID=UPI003676427E
MKQLELVIVQFEEVKKLITVERVPQLRLAFILLDSAVELIMHRKVERELDGERWQFDELEKYRKMEQGGQVSDWGRRRIAELAPQVTSKRRRKKINDTFGAKVEFLVERDALPDEVLPVLSRLHEYRNETYHRDEHRVDVLLPAVLIYFDVACTVLSTLRPRWIEDEETGPELERFLRGMAGWPDPFKLPEYAAATLRSEVGLDLAAVRSSLMNHLLARLEQVDGFIREVMSFGRKSYEEAIEFIQWDEKDSPTDERDVLSWRERAEALVSVVDKHALFSEFAAIEISLEPFERQAIDAMIRIDEEINLQIDIARGK